MKTTRRNIIGSKHRLKSRTIARAENSHRFKVREARKNEIAPVSVSCSLIAVCAVALLALWLNDLFVLKTPLLTRFHGAPPLTPLYAFWMPVLRPQALCFAAVAAAFVFFAMRLCDPAVTSRRLFMGSVFLFGLVLPFALFLVRQDPHELGSQFLIYANEEFYADAGRISALGPFIREFVNLMPNLSLHGQHFPPGNAALLYLIREIFGPGTQIAGAAVLFIFAGGMIFAYLGLTHLTTDVAARQGSLFLFACPSLLDFACTSMDAVFFALAMLSWWLSLRALSDRGRVHDALLVGAALALSSFFSFSTFPVGMMIAAYALYSGRKSRVRAITRLTWIGAGFTACIVTLYLISGFPLWSSVEIAYEKNFELMTNILGRNPRSVYPLICYGNAVAFATGSGLAIVSAAVARLRRRRLTDDEWSIPALGAIAIMSFGGIYFMETERIWLFAMPWVAGLSVASMTLTSNSMRLLLGVGLIQMFMMETLLFTLW